MNTYPPPPSKLEAISDKLATYEDAIINAVAGTIVMTIVTVVLVAALVVMAVLISGYSL